MADIEIFQERVRALEEKKESEPFRRRRPRPKRNPKGYNFLPPLNGDTRSGPLVLWLIMEVSNRVAGRLDE